MNPLGAAITTVLCLIVIGGSSRWAAAAILFGVCYITQGQQINFGLHFTAIRLVLLAGLIRVMVRGEFKRMPFVALDKTLVAYAFVLAIVPIIRSHTMDEVVYQSGFLYNVFLSYFVFRSLLNQERGIEKVLILLAYIVAPFALLVVQESANGHNVFSVFGGVAELSMVRDGNVRSQGSFRQPITAGSFGATCALLFAGLLFGRTSRRWPVILGLLASLAIVISAHSSGPFLGLMLGFVALACWPFRRHTRKIRWGILLTLIGLHLVMKAPVWFLLGRISDLVGGGGYHRAYLIDRFINEVRSWWLLGTTGTADWMATQLEGGGADLTNQFVSDGVNAGFLGLIFSIMLVVRCFQSLAKARQEIATSDPDKERLLWSLGATLVGSIAILFSVTYFDQMHVVWYFFLACISTASSVFLERSSGADLDSRVEVLRADSHATALHRWRGTAPGVIR
jgi:hypothetical protein